MSALENFPPKEGLRLEGGIIVLPRDASRKPRKGLLDCYLDMGLTGLSVFIERDGFVADAFRTFRLMLRLHGIRQLQSLTWIRVNGRRFPLPDVDHTFPHTRLMPHAILAAVLRALTCHFTLKCDPTETLVAILEDLVHDIATCAGGDVWKTLDLGDKAKQDKLSCTLFNEDNRLLEFFERYAKSWEKLRRKYGLPRDTPSRVAKAVRDEVGLDGAFHTMADSLSYLSSDVELLLSLSDAAGLTGDHLSTIRELARSDAFDLWKHLAVVNGQLVSTRPDILEKFLRLRLLMWTEVYDHPGHKAIELLLSNVVYPYLWKQRSWKPNKLLSWHDGHLEKLVEAEIGSPGLLRRIDAAAPAPRRELYQSQNEALRAEDEKARQGKLTILVDTNRLHTPSTKTTKFRVIGPNGRPTTFDKAYPNVNQELAELARAPSDGARFHLIHFQPAARTATLEKAWHEARGRWQNAA